MPETPLTFGSLFAGIGGFDLGFERAGMLCKWQVEIDQFCRKVLAKHWPDVKRFEDVREVGRHNLEPVDVVCGGDPCQENSAARTTDNTTSPSLGDQFIRVVEELMPGIVVRENPSHVRADAPWPWQRFRSELRRLGYAVLPIRLRACCFGFDHRRDRLFLLGEKIRDAGSQRRKRYQQGTRIFVAEKTPLSIYGNADAGTGPVVESVDWRLPGTNGISVGLARRHVHAIGNAVVPQVAEWIGKRIIAAYI